MQTPILYIKKGCPYCEAAIEYLKAQGIHYEAIDVRKDSRQMAALKEVSGQIRTPTLVWNGDVLANFGVEELKPFLEQRKS